MNTIQHEGKNTMSPENAEKYLRKNFRFRITTGCIQEACENNWIPNTLTNNRYSVIVADVIKRYIK